jgi:hypothetical protein
LLDKNAFILSEPHFQLEGGPNMSCKSCGSHTQSKFSVEMNIHFPGYEGLEKPTVRVFSDVVICLNCGFAEFSVAKPELRALAKRAGT